MVVKPFYCEICNITFEYKSKYRRHLESSKHKQYLHFTGDLELDQEVEEVTPIEDVTLIEEASPIEEVTPIEEGTPVTSSESEVTVILNISK